MKLSNKILLGLLAVVFFYLTAAFVEVRFSGTPNIMNDKNSVSETRNISGVRYLVVNAVEKEINVIGSDRAHLEIRSITGDLLKRLNYKISGDTLTLSDFKSDDKQSIKISVYLPKADLKGIAVDGGVVHARELQSDVLTIRQKSGTVWLSNSKISKIELTSSRGYMDIAANIHLDTLSTDMERSHVYLHTDIGALQGTLRDGAILYVRDVREIQLKKDETSLLNVYQGGNQ